MSYFNRYLLGGVAATPIIDSCGSYINTTNYPNLKSNFEGCDFVGGDTTWSTKNGTSYSMTKSGGSMTTVAYTPSGTAGTPGIGGYWTGTGGYWLDANFNTKLPKTTGFPFTFEMVIRAASLNTSQYFLGSPTPSADGEWRYIAANDGIAARRGAVSAGLVDSGDNANTNSGGMSATNRFNTTTLYHIVLTMSARNGIQRFYRNGVEDTGGTYSFGPDATKPGVIFRPFPMNNNVAYGSGWTTNRTLFTASVRVGARGTGTNPFLGQMYAYNLYQQELSSAEISANYAHYQNVYQA